MKIGTISKRTGLSAHTIRYYEKLGLIKRANKDSSGHRSYSARDEDLFNWISCLKKSGLPLNHIKQYICAFNENDQSTMALILKKHLQVLTAKKTDLVHYISVTSGKINKLKTA